MRKLLTLVLVFAGITAAAGQQPVELKVWPDGAPNSNGLTGEEQPLENGRVANITDPVLYVYKADPAKNTGASIVICPGGGYIRLAMNHEGHDVARWLAANGITAAVLKYRMPNGNYEVPLSDAAQSIRIMREHAEEWGLDPKKVGISGNSAGGHLAATAATHYDTDTRPDFAVLFYPVITFDPQIAHPGSGRSLLGENASEELRNLYSNEKQVSSDTPPTLIFHSDDDRSVPVLNSLVFYAALKNHQVPASLYIFPKGGHGWGYTPEFEYLETWKSLYLGWLKDNNFID